MACHLKVSNTQHQGTSEGDLLTVHHHPHSLGKTVDNLNDLRCGYPGFILRESIQPLDNRVDVLPSRKLLYKIFCVTLNRVRGQ